MEELGAPQDVIDKAYHLISKHEYGGDEEQNILKDADSISFLETNAEYFVKVFTFERGRKVVQKKLDWMFDRITSDKAREYASPFYDKYIKMFKELN